MMPKTYWPVGHAARRAGVNPTVIRRRFDRGELRGTRDATGRRLLDPDDCERFALERARGVEGRR